MFGHLEQPLTHTYIHIYIYIYIYILTPINIVSEIIFMKLNLIGRKPEIKVIRENLPKQPVPRTKQKKKDSRLYED